MTMNVQDILRKLATDQNTPKTDKPTESDYIVALNLDLLVEVVRCHKERLSRIEKHIGVFAEEVEDDG